MSRNIIDLPVEDIYGKIHIGFAPIFEESVFLLKKLGYERILDMSLDMENTVFIFQKKALM